MKSKKNNSKSNKFFRKNNKRFSKVFDLILNKLHIKKATGITQRWLVNIIGVIGVFFVVVFIVSSFAIKTYYYNSVESILNSGASTTAVSYFSSNLDSGTSLEESASDFIDSYSYKDKTTIWIIDNDGKVVRSSTGFAIDNDISMPDYIEALSNENGTARYVGRISKGGEKSMAVTRVISNSDGKSVGAVRVISSLEMIDSQIRTAIFLIFIGLLVVFAIILYSNLFFIRSIIIPVQDINTTTKKISQGDYSVRIEKIYNDEIGDLCDSINSMAEEISTTDKMKNDFISTISHELRTPLTSIKGWGETLAFGCDDDSVDEITRKGLHVIVSEAGRLEGFVEELLDFSRLQSGRMNLKKTKIDIFAELDETLFTFRERAMREGITVKYSIPELPAPAMADSNRLKQVFMNILDNALKYSRAPSKIFIKAEFSKKDGEDFIKIAIADQGCGISKEDLPHVKEKFYKANMSVRGSGIGLAVTNEIVELHGGKLEIDSAEGRGTLVTMYLPIENAPSKKQIQLQPQTDEIKEIDHNIEIATNDEQSVEYSSFQSSSNETPTDQKSEPDGNVDSNNKDDNKDSSNNVDDEPEPEFVSTVVKIADIKPSVSKEKNELIDNENNEVDDTISTESIDEIVDDNDDLQDVDIVDNIDDVENNEKPFSEDLKNDNSSLDANEDSGDESDVVDKSKSPVNVFLEADESNKEIDIDNYADDDASLPIDEYVNESTNDNIKKVDSNTKSSFGSNIPTYGYAPIDDENIKNIEGDQLSFDNSKKDKQK